MKLLTKTVCPKCMFVKSQLAGQGLEVETVNIEHDAEAYAMLVGAGIMAVPVLVSGDKLITDLGEIVEEVAKNS